MKLVRGGVSFSIQRQGRLTAAGVSGLTLGGRADFVKGERGRDEGKSKEVEELHD